MIQTSCFLKQSVFCSSMWEVPLEVEIVLLINNPSLIDLALCQGLEQPQKQFFTYTFAKMYLYTIQKTSKKRSDWQILVTFWFQRNTPGFALVYYFAWTDCKQAMNRHKKMAEVSVYHAN